MTDATALKLIVEDASGQRTVVPVVLDAQGELLIGRGATCGLRLNERNVSRNHAKLALVEGAFVVVDLGAYNGVVVNGSRIEGQKSVTFGDGIRIGDFQLELRQSDALGPEITKPSLLIGNDEGTEPEGEQRALIRKLAEEPTTPGPNAQAPAAKGPEGPSDTPQAPAAVTVGHKPVPVQLTEEPTEILPRNEDAAKAAPLTPPFAHFVCIIGEQAGRTYAIDRATLVIGRTQDNDIAIDHRSMSRHHVKIVVTQGRYRIVDLDSANGLLVNDEAYTDTELKHGDIAELGHVKLRFVAPAEPTVLTTEEREQAQEQRRPSKKKAQAGRRAPLAAAVLLGVGIAGSYVYLARVPEPGAVAGAAVPGSDRTEEEHLLMQARQAIALRNYPRAEALAGAVLELEPSRDEARQILSQCALEQKGHDQLESAVSAASRENWAQAYDALKEVPRASSASSRAATLMEQVRPALVAARVLAVKKAVQAEHFDDAEHELAALEALQLGVPQVTELHDAIEAGKKARAGRATEPAAAASAQGKGHEPSSASRSGHAGADEPRQLYADGLHALSGGHTERAVELLLRCVSQDKNYARCHRALGIAYAKMGNGAKMARYYRQYLKVDPQAKDASSVKQLLQQYDSGSDHAGTTMAPGPGGANAAPQAP